MGPRDLDGSASVSASSGGDDFQLPAKETVLSSTAEAWLLGELSVTTSAVPAGSGDMDSCVLGPPLSPELFDGDAKSAGDAELVESLFCKKCFKRVFLGILLFKIELRS